MITDYVKERRWFRAKSRKLVATSTAETFPLDLAGEHVDFSIIDCTYEDGGTDRYVLPTALAASPESDRLRAEHPHLVIGTTPEGATIYDALGSERILGFMLDAFKGGGMRVENDRSIAKERATLRFRPFPALESAFTANLAPMPTKTEQTNTSIVFGDAFILKIVRKLDDGVSAELEMGEFLTRHGYASSPQVVGSIEIERPNAPAATVGILHRFVANRGDAWTATLKELETAADPVERYRSWAERLGKIVGEMHVALATGTEAAFVVEPMPRHVRSELAAAVEKQARDLDKWLRPRDDARIAKRLAAFVDLEVDPIRMRVHGDLHLGQILAVGDAKEPDFVLIDFEGEPARSLAERKAKRSPLADVAGMLRSFDYAAATALRQKSPAGARGWSRDASAAFLRAYRETTKGASALSTPDEVLAKSLEFYVLEKCLYEVAYEADNRPDWIAVPRDGLYDLLDATP